MPSPFISVLIPVFNRADAIGRCLSSVAGQTLPPAQIVVIDNASPDGTEAAVRQWAADRPEQGTHLSYHYQQNAGKNAALNAGVQVATGDWIAFSNSDDVWVPHKLKRQFEILAAHPSAKSCISDFSFANDPSRERATSKP